VIDCGWLSNFGGWGTFWRFRLRLAEMILGLRSLADYFCGGLLECRPAASVTPVDWDASALWGFKANVFDPIAPCNPTLGLFHSMT